MLSSWGTGRRLSLKIKSYLVGISIPLGTCLYGVATTLTTARLGCWIFDFWAGVELNPQFGPLDLKFFHNGRPGIVAWTLMYVYAVIPLQRG